jgi:hypothetical protein
MLAKKRDSWQQKGNNPRLRKSPDTEPAKPEPNKNNQK